MQKFTSITAKTIPVPIKDVDTDMILPAQFLTSISKDGYGQNLFRRLRDKDPQFPFNEPKYKGAEIMITDSNFGCGSSREHAVWAIMGAGIKAVISKSFADIFYNNSAKNGLVLVTLPEAAVDDFLIRAKSGDFCLTIDMEKQEVREANGKIYSFDYDPFRRHCILNGLDDIDYILSMKNDINEFRKKQTTIMPKVSTK